jgi:hypothetical protein
MQDGFLPFDDERMARVVPALESDDGMSALGEHVDDSALALISPLRPDDDDAASQGLTSHDEQQSQSADYDAKSESPELPVLEAGERGEPAAPRLRERERK